MISTVEWAQFKSDLDSFTAETAQQEVTWRHLNKNLPRYNEGETKSFTLRILKCVVSYNAFRVWPISEETVSGNVDKEYCYLLLNNQYLQGQGWLDATHNLDYDPNHDVFVVNGVEHEDSGQTPISQDKSDPLYNVLILKRKTTNTGHG